MQLARRQFLQLAMSAAVLPTVSGVANAQAYPARPVRIVVGFAAGGAADTVARLIGQQLSERLGQQFIIENRPGAGTNLATEEAVRAAPDGYTLLLVTGANASNTTLYDHLNFDFMRDITPIALVDRHPLIAAVHPSVPVTTVPELIAYAKAHPGEISMGSGGNGSAIHMAETLFLMMTGTDMVHVPYRGEALALTDLLGGHVQVVFGSVAASLGYVKAGKVRALAVTTTTRCDLLPDIPAIAEFVPGYDASAWHGIGAPEGTPAEIVSKLNRTINAALSDDGLKARLANLGAAVLVGSAADFKKFIADETAKWAKVIKFANVKAE